MESGFEVDDMKAYTSVHYPSVHHHALSKNKVGMSFYHGVQRFSIYDSEGTRKRVTFDSNVKVYEYSTDSVELCFEEKKEEKVKPLGSRQAPCSSKRSHVTSNSSGSYRYQNCRESDDEDEDITDCDVSDDDDSCLLDDYYEDKWDNEVNTEEIADNVVLDIEKSTASTARDRSGYVNALLNPIENLSQWKAVKSNGRTTQAQSPKLSSFSIKQKSRDETSRNTVMDFANSTYFLP